MHRLKKKKKKKKEGKEEKNETFIALQRALCFDNSLATG